MHIHSTVSLSVICQCGTLLSRSSFSYFILDIYGVCKCCNFAVIGGPIGQLLQQNAQTLDQISANLDNLKVG